MEERQKTERVVRIGGRNGGNIDSEGRRKEMMGA